MNKKVLGSSLIVAFFLINLSFTSDSRSLVDKVSPRSESRAEATSYLPASDAVVLIDAKRLLNEAHVVTVPGEAFGTQEHIRLSYATSSGEIARGLERMQDWFSKL